MGINSFLIKLCLPLKLTNAQALNVPSVIVHYDTPLTAALKISSVLEAQLLQLNHYSHTYLSDMLRRSGILLKDTKMCERTS